MVARIPKLVQYPRFKAESKRTESRYVTTFLDNQKGICYGARVSADPASLFQRNGKKAPLELWADFEDLTMPNFQEGAEQIIRELTFNGARKAWIKQISRFLQAAYQKGFIAAKENTTGCKKCGLPRAYQVFCQGHSLEENEV